MAPWFAQAERRLNIGPWLTPPNENNDLLRARRAQARHPAAVIQRNVKGCWNLGSCGMGCPTNAKQSMLVTTIPAALDKGATLLTQTRARAVRAVGRQGAVALLCEPVARRRHAGIAARRRASSRGTTSSPAARSTRRRCCCARSAPDPHGLLGTRTFLHPVVLSAATFEQTVEGWNGAPQTIYSDHFLDTQPIDGPIGYKLEAPPHAPADLRVDAAGLRPAAGRHAAALSRTRTRCSRCCATASTQQSPGGQVTLRGDGSPVLDYPLNDFVMDGARRALLSMAEIQFAAGAQTVLPVHELAAAVHELGAGARRRSARCR